MLECPKCGTEMVTRNRNGIMIEECGGCGGVYLDRGELELLIDAESQYLATLPAAESSDTTDCGSPHRPPDRPAARAALACRPHRPA